MIRAFLALSLPEALHFDLGLVQQGLPVPRAVPPQNLHLTLAFLGDVAQPSLADLDVALGRVSAPSFALSLSGLGIFGGAKPKLVYAGVSPSEPLMHLQAKLVQAARLAGIDVEARKYHPHVTLARLRPRQIDRKRLEAAVAGRAGYRSAPFEVGDFVLFRSHLGGEAAHYEPLARYPLKTSSPVGADSSI